jgi:glycosyltransferase involved in cell wall biosynthesis
LPVPTASTIETTPSPDVSRHVDVLAVIDHLALGGAQMLLSQFAGAAPSVGIRFAVACLRAGDENPASIPLEAAGVSALNLEAQHGRPTLRTLQLVRRHIAASRPDIVHTHLGHSDWIGGLAGRSLGIPVVCTIHTAVWPSGVQINALRRVVKLCDSRIVAVSNSARRAYEKREWARPGQLVVIHNGVDPPLATGEGGFVRRELGWGQDDLVLGMISSLRAEKAHDVAIAAFRLLREEFPTLRLLIAGEGPTGDELARLSHDLRPSVALTGLRADVMRCMDASDICLHPSRADAFPTTLIEAMAASVPVLATDVGGIPEIVEDGHTGVLVPAPPAPEVIAGALRALLPDDARRIALGRAGRQSYEARFTADRWVSATRALYDDVLADG